MRFTVRRKIFWSFIIAFFLLSPFLIVYTAGYRFDATLSTFIKTGTIILSTDPRQALISLNGKDTGKTTPTLIRGLKPGRYDLAITKSGYLSWGKKLSVESDQATFVSDVRLFKDVSPTLRLKGDNLSLWSTPNGTQTILVEETNTNPKTFNLSLLPRIPHADLIPVTTLTGKTIAFVDWSPDETKVILLLNDEWVLLNLATFQHTTLRKTDVPAKAFALRFAGDNSLYAATTNQVFLLEKKASGYSPKPMNDSASSIEKNSRITDFWILNNRVYEVIVNDEAPSLLRVSKISSRNTTTTSLPNSGDYRFIAGDSKTVVLRHVDEIDVFDVSSATPSILKKIPGGETASLNQNSQMLYTQGFELQRLDLKTDSSTLLFRASEAMRDIAWFFDGSHALFGSDQGISVVDFQDPQPFITWLISPVSKLQNYATTTDGTSLYFIGNISDGTSGLFERPL